jgi:flagellar M-ring protein FliF
MNALLHSLRSLGTRRLAALGAVGAATLGLMLAVILRAASPAPMAPLYSDLDLRDAAAMADALDKAHIPHAGSDDGGSLLVPRDQLPQARLALARSGLPNGGGVGYELFDRGNGLGATQFEQDINETRALEGELARSIRLIRGVRGVRVHLVLPRHEPFAQEQQEAQASVLLTLAGAGGMDRESVQSILNLVAAAVPGLKPSSIAIIDNQGELLARAGQPTAADTGASTQDELRRAMETRLAHTVEAILEPTLGVGHVRAEAAVDLDFDQTHETEEKYDPDGQVPRSTQLITDTSKSTQKSDAVTVQNNLPNPDPGASGGAGDQAQRHEETTNYEIGKTTREVVHSTPLLRRISLAVLVDGVTTPGPNGIPVWHERSPADLDRIATLARSAIGYDQARGDTVDIVSMRFADTGADQEAAQGLAASVLAAPDLGRLLCDLLFGGVALAALLAVLRPAALRLATGIAAPAEASAALLPGAEPTALLGDETMIDVANVEGQIRASSIRRIAELIDRQPEESVAVLRGWMAQETA